MYSSLKHYHCVQLSATLPLCTAVCNCPSVQISLVHRLPSIHWTDQASGGLVDVLQSACSYNNDRWSTLTVVPERSTGARYRSTTTTLMSNTGVITDTLLHVVHPYSAPSRCSVHTERERHHSSIRYYPDN